MASVAVLAFGGWQLYAIGCTAEPCEHDGRFGCEIRRDPSLAGPETPSAPAASHLPSITETLSAHSGETNLDAAFSKLFGLWGATYRPGSTDACDQAAQQGLECVMQRGSWGQLRALNRPAILMLNDDAGIEHQLVLSQARR